MVSTHSRLKAAGLDGVSQALGTVVSTHSRLKAAGKKFCWNVSQQIVSTHSRLKAAGCQMLLSKTHTPFQHTAA